MPSKRYYGSKKKTKSRGKLGGRTPKKTLNTNNSQPEPVQIPTEQIPVPSTSTFGSADHIPTECGTYNLQPSTLVASSEKIYSFQAYNKRNSSKDKKHNSPNGFRVVNIDSISNLIEELACPTCFQVSLSLEERPGGNLQVNCSKCKKPISRKPFSKTAHNSKSSEVNIRLITAGRSTGIGYEKMVKFFGILNAPIPLHLKTHQGLSKKLHRAVLQASSKVEEEAVSILKSKFYLDQNFDGPLPITITYDGTWHKRGHSSHFGVGIVIDLCSGFVIDTAVISNYCHGCQIGPNKEEENYKDWLENHKSHCQQNFSGSANAMEVEAAKILFSRSVDNYNLMYTTMLCDGDSKAFNSVKEMNPYNTEIRKEDCINHVAKRMYHALDSLKKTTKGIGGRGKLTKEAMEKMTKSYASSLKRKAPDVEEMKKAVYAGFFHMCSTDEEPHHKFCPKDIDSWCHYNRHHAQLAAGIPSQPKKHRPAIPKDIAELVLPIYERLTDKELLSRCSRMKTQNNNESFNGMIWQRCPKTEFASRMTVETAVALSVIEFNCGPKGLARVLELMGVNAGDYFEVAANRAIERRILKAKRASSEKVQKRRKQLKMHKAKKSDVIEQLEGLTYNPGAFNI